MAAASTKAGMKTPAWLELGDIVVVGSWSLVALGALQALPFWPGAPGLAIAWVPVAVIGWARPAANGQLPLLRRNRHQLGQFVGWVTSYLFTTLPASR